MMNSRDLYHCRAAAKRAAQVLGVAALLLVVTGCTSAPEEPEPISPYAGDEARAIKALSQSEIDAYLAGEGMGLARAAELNHYPGPKHVLALADALGLEEAQRGRTQRFFETMQAEAIALGRKIVEKERELDALFAEQQASAGDVRAMLLALGELQAELRLVHLKAHIQMREVLSDEQVAHYDQLRGYNAEAPPGQHIHEEMHH